jgi:hypothetical protein
VAAPGLESQLESALVEKAAVVQAPEPDVVAPSDGQPVPQPEVRSDPAPIEDAPQQGSVPDSPSVEIYPEGNEQDEEEAPVDLPDAVPTGSPQPPTARDQADFSREVGWRISVSEPDDADPVEDGDISDAQSPMESPVESEWGFVSDANVTVSVDQPADLRPGKFGREVIEAIRRDAYVHPERRIVAMGTERGWLMWFTEVLEGIGRMFFGSSRGRNSRPNDSDRN